MKHETSNEPPLPRPHRASGGARASGLAILVLLVVVGLGAGAGLYRYKQPRAVAALRAEVAAAPTTTDGLLELWHTYTAPQIHGLVAATRISQQQPWLVTHQIRPPASLGAPQAARVYGIDVDALPATISRVADGAVRIELPRPHFLAETVLVGDNARDVPSFSDELDDAEMIARLETIAAHLFGTVAGGLAKEARIGGTPIELWIEGEPEAYVIQPVAAPRGVGEG